MPIVRLNDQGRLIAEENEWRLVYLSQWDRDEKYRGMLGYTITDRGVESKLKLRIADMPGALARTLSLDGLIDRLILGPSLSTDLAADAIIRMLEINGRSGLARKVVASTIPSGHNGVVIRSRVCKPT